MATIKTVIKRAGGKPKLTKSGETIIYIKYNHQQNHFLISTGVRINPDLWDGDKNQNYPVKGNGRTTKNELIGQARQSLEKAVAELNFKNIEPTVDAVKNLLQKKKVKTSLDVFQLYERYIESSEGIKAKLTVEGLKRCRNNFVEYCQHKKITPTLESINLQFYNSFVKYFLEKRGMSNNSVGKEVKTLKAFLHWCQDHGHKISPDIRKFKVFKEKTVIVFLTEEEIDRLYHYDFSDKPRLARVRDLFIFNCYTGLRWSDLSRLNRDHIQGNLIRLRQHKSKNDVLIPLTPRSAAILEKYDHELPLISEQNLNAYIKEACQLAGIDQPVETATYQGGKKHYKKLPKYELVSVHTGIKSFISLAVKKGVPVKVISEITGKSQQVINRHYLGADEKSIVDWMGKAFGTV